MARSSVHGGVRSAMGTPSRVGLCLGLLVVALLAVESVAAQGSAASANVEVTVATHLESRPALRQYAPRRRQLANPEHRA